jgi:restriction system protein
MLGAAVKVASWWARIAFDYRAAAILPFVVFLVILIVGLVLLGAAFGRGPDAYGADLVALGTVAAVGLYVSALYLFGGLMMSSQRWRLLQLHQTMREIREMSWQRFEDLVVGYYESQGYSVEHTGNDTGDDGIDAVLHKNGKTWLVQCKHKRDEWVRPGALKEFLGMVTSRRAEGGIFVAAGVFDDKALAFARTSPQLQLIGGEQLRDLLEAAVSARSGRHDEFCPECGGPMRRVNGRRGPFLSCANYPACAGKRQLPAS